MTKCAAGSCLPLRPACCFTGRQASRASRQPSSIDASSCFGPVNGPHSCAKPPRRQCPQARALAMEPPTTLGPAALLHSSTSGSSLRQLARSPLSLLRPATPIHLPNFATRRGDRPCPTRPLLMPRCTADPTSRAPSLRCLFSMASGAPGEAPPLDRQAPPMSTSASFWTTRRTLACCMAPPVGLPTPPSLPSYLRVCGLDAL